ncbi:MAG: RNA polymerase sigma factor [Armatimonadota bacterium]
MNSIPFDGISSGGSVHTPVRSGFLTIAGITETSALYRPMSNLSHNTNMPDTGSMEESAAGFAQDSDLALVRRAQAGDTAAFGDLIERHQRAVYGVVSRMVTSRDDVDDLAQDIFISAYKSIGSFRGDARFSTWLHTIAVNTTLKRMKSLKRGNAMSLDDADNGLAATLPDDGVLSPSESLQKSARDESVRKAIDTLPDKHKMVVVMHYFEHNSCEEIAEILGCSVGTVWSRLHYACRKLKGEFRRLELDL